MATRTYLQPPHLQRPSGPGEGAAWSGWPTSLTTSVVAAAGRGPLRTTLPEREAS